MITRRKFIQAIGLAGAAGMVLKLDRPIHGQTLSTDELFLVPAKAMNDPVLSFTSQHFTPFINTEFEIRRKNMRGAEMLILLDVKDLERKENISRGFSGANFSLMFASPQGAEIRAGLYKFTHFSLGSFTLDINPVSPEPNRFEAVINHLSLQPAG